MILTTTEVIPGKETVEILGVVRGNTVRARHIGSDIAAGFKSIVGGEIKSYVRVLTEARREADERMIKEAEVLGAHAIVEIRYATSQIMDGAAEILAYGAAVKIK